MLKWGHALTNIVLFTARHIKENSVPSIFTVYLGEDWTRDKHEIFTVLMVDAAGQF